MTRNYRREYLQRDIRKFVSWYKTMVDCGHIDNTKTAVSYEYIDTRKCKCLYIAFIKADDDIETIIIAPSPGDGEFEMIYQTSARCAHANFDYDSRSLILNVLKHMCVDYDTSIAHLTTHNLRS